MLELTSRQSALLLLAASMRAAAKRDDTLIHRAADTHLNAMTLAVMYAFLKGRKAYKSGGTKAAVAAVHAGLLQSLPPVLAKCFAAGGNAGVGMLPKARAASNPEGINQYSHGGAKPLDSKDLHARGFYLEPYQKNALDSGHSVLIDVPVSKASGTEYDKHGGLKADDKSTLAIKEHLNSGGRVPVIEGSKGVGDKWHVADGQHRLAAHSQRGEKMIPMIVPKSDRLRAAADKTFNIRFDQSSPEAIAWAKEHAGELATDLSATSEQAIKDAIAAELSGEGSSVDAILAAVGDSDRAELIARTEVMTAANEGQRAAWESAVDAGLLPANAVVEWIATSDACDDCLDLDGETRPIDGEYDDSDAGDGPPLHPNCRCTEGIGA
jgi:hypothetical protein